MKRFYNNTKMSGAFGKALRMLALLCVLLGFSSSAWAGYLICGPDAMGLSYDSGKEMTKSGAVYTYTFTATNDAKPAYVRFYNGSISDSNWMGCDEWQPQVNLETNYTCTQNKKTEYKINITKNTTYTITLTAKSESDLSSAILFVSEHCRPKSSLISATYNVETKKIDLVGSLINECNENIDYGFAYRKSGEINNYTNLDKVGTKNTSVNNYNAECDASQFDAGAEYVFVAYAKQGGTYIYSSNTARVKMPVPPSNVLLTKDAVYNEDAKKANLYGYLRQNPEQDGGECIRVVEYGFVLAEGMGSKPTISNIKLNVGNNDYILSRGETFSGEIGVLESGESSEKLIKGNVYAYRAYMIVGKDVFYSSEIRYLSTGKCIPQPGGNGTIYITVDGSRNPANDDDCGLVYSDLQVALEELKANPIYTDTETGNLLQAVVINVSQFDNAAGETGRGNYVGGKYLENGEVNSGKTYAVCGGDNGSTRDLRVLAIEKFNYNEDAETYDPEHTLTIQANNGDKPRIEHILIRNSRNIILKGLNILSNNDGTTKDTALEMDAGFAGGNWGTVTIEKEGIKDANIIVKDCSIGSNGFTGVHINSYSGLTFENNTFNLSIDDVSQNAYGWGASVKFFECDNIKFIRNNFWGGHATLLWLQQTTNALFYNNVFWNTNQYDQDGCVAVRACAQYNERSSNIAVLYNTFYVAEDNGTKAKKYDFLKFGINSDADGYKAEQDKNYTGKFYFKYNNCYSYDKEMNGKTSSPCSKYTPTKETLCPNNFWSVYDQKKYNEKKIEAEKTAYRSVFDIDVCTKVYINVGDLICETTASGPAELVIRDLGGEGLRVGNPISTQDIHRISSILLTDEELLSDRYRSRVRQGEKWTMGALEATATNYVETIYWIGRKNGNWDDRGNWAYILDEGSAATTRAANQRTLTCVDILSPNLKIVIPQKGSAKYPTATTSTYYYPEIPASFDATNREESGIPEGEQVSAGVGVPNASIEKYATSIELEYGAALKGVHRLWDQSANKFRYDEGITNMTLERDQWTLVGPVVLPWDDKDKNTTRDVMSNDYFLNYEPNVYMRRAEVGGTATEPSLTWNKTFAELDSLCKPNTAFAVTIPNSYGNYWGIGLSAQDYYGSICGLTGDALNEKLADVTVPKSFRPFVGRFVNDKELITYSKLSINQPVLLNNSYPCNIDVQKLEGDGNSNGIVYLYDYIAKSIKVAGDDSWTAEGSYKGYNGVNTQYIKPQNGFVFIPKKSSV
ncbi:MAG: right-handed parallel beta-helix repeat-containing protein, partial [Paludibacteraceae bacterium]|nr:right-handed parallel beta-helix repeat-containing protein [Paludibacteraceae bacterium]